MSDHYYSSKPSSSSDEKKLQVQLFNETFSFLTDNGVFSKETVDFGSQLLMETFYQLVKNHAPENVLELGSGYGPIVIGLAKVLPETDFIGVELNNRAYHLALKNAELNQIENITFIEADATSFERNELVDHVLTNPPIRAGKATIQQFIETAYSQLKSNGSCWVVIQKKQGAPSMKKYMEELFGSCDRVALKKGYWILKSIKA